MRLWDVVGVVFLLLLFLASIFFIVRSTYQDFVCKSYLSARYDLPRSGFHVYDFNRVGGNNSVVICKYGSVMGGLDFDIFVVGVDPK